MDKMQKKEKNTREYKGVRDEIRQQQMKMKDMSFKERLSYFWYYYKIHTLVLLTVIIFTVSLVHTLLTSKDFNFYGILLNSDMLSGDAMEESFGAYAGLDMENYECFIDTNSTMSLTSSSQYDLATSQKLIALMQTKDLDAIVFDSQVFQNYAFNEMLLDLRTLFSEEELERYGDLVYYIDYAEIKKAEEEDQDEVDAFTEELASTPEEMAEEAETHRHPETMEEPVPVGIFLSGSPFAEETGAYEALVPVFGIPVTTLRQDTAKQFLNFLMDDSIDFSRMTVSYE